VVLLENLGEGSFRKRVLLEGVDRVADVQAGDLNGDGLLDLSAAMFGYYEGEVRWLENRGGYEFVSHILLALPGAIHVPMADMNGDGLIDIVALLSQEYEEVHVFENRGGGQFSDRVVWGSGNEDWGSSGIAVADMNRDGYPDIVYTNGDAFDYFAPVPRPWHGVQWLQNDGRGGFDSHRLGDLPGAYMPRVVDLDGGGLLDIVAVSTFNQWDREDAESLASFLQKEDGSFERRTLARSPISLLALDSADMDGDGRVELITGGFHALPPYERMSRVLWWRPQE